MVMDSPENKPDSGKRWGQGTEEENIQRSSAENPQIPSYMIGPLERIKTTPWREIGRTEKEGVVEVLRGTIVDNINVLNHRLEQGLQNFDYKTYFYTVQNETDQVGRLVQTFENGIMGLPKGAEYDANERILGRQVIEMDRVKSGHEVWKFVVPYKTLYYSGWDSMKVLPQRGGQLFMGHLSNLFVGQKDPELFTPPAPPESGTQPDSHIAQQEEEMKKWQEELGVLPELNERGETITDRFGNYVADADFFFRAIGEMNTYNSSIRGETLQLSETMTEFLGEMFQKQPRILEDGSEEKSVKIPTRKIKVYLDADGKQVPLNKDGKPRDETKVVETHEQYVDLLDYYNKSDSTEQSLHVLCTIAAMTIHRAKESLDKMSHIAHVAKNARPTDGAKSDYEKLKEEVEETAKKMMKQRRVVKRSDAEYMLARSAVYLADGIAFGTFDIGERGGSYSWEPEVVDKDGKPLKIKRGGEELSLKTVGYKLEVSGSYPDVTFQLIDTHNKGVPVTDVEWFVKWKAGASQGDPTASGDAFSALKPYLHDAIYQAIKSRASSFGQGANLPINPDYGETMVDVFMSKQAEKNERKRIVEMIKSGRHQYLAAYFGMLGAFKKDLGGLKAWQKGAEKMKVFKKKVNPNFSKAVEDYVVFVPTPFSFGEIKNPEVAMYVRECGIDPEEAVIYPMLNPQQKIGLFDMLSVGKKYSVGDMLRRTWKKDAQDHWVEAPVSEGGRRLTMKQIHWEQYLMYGEDGRAVNDNFMSQLYEPVYGVLNPKAVEAVEQNPMAAMTLSVKAADIGFRWIFKEFDYDNLTEAEKAAAIEIFGEKVERPSLEIMHGEALQFQLLAIGGHGLIGNGALDRFRSFTHENLPGSGQDPKANMYTMLRAAEDLLPEKQGYENYSDTWCAALLASTYALKPVSLASHEMAFRTTMRFNTADPTGRVEWKKLDENDNQKQGPIKPQAPAPISFP